MSGGLLQVWPAQVTMPDGTRHAKARVAAHGGRLGVWVGRGELAAVWSVTDDVLPGNDGRGLRTFTVETADGPLTVSKGSGCGCGSPLSKLDVVGELAAATVPA